MALVRFDSGVYQQDRNRIYPRYSPSYTSSPTKVFLEEIDEDDNKGGYAGYIPRTIDYPRYYPGFYNSKVEYKQPYAAFGYLDTFKPEPRPLVHYPTIPQGPRFGANITPVLTQKFTKDAFRWIGYLLCFLAILSFGFEIANLAVTVSASDAYNSKPCSPPYGFMVVPWFFTWVAPGIWASIPIFISGLLAIIVVDNFGRVFQALAIFSSLSTFFFAPAIIAISGAELGTFVNACNTSIDQINSFQTMLGLKFVFPIIVIVIGILELIFLLILTIMLCRAYDTRNATPMLLETNQVETELVQIPAPIDPAPVAVAPDPYPIPIAIPPPPPIPMAFPPSFPRALPPTLPPPRTGGVGGGRIVVLEEHDSGHISTNYPVAQTTGAAGYYWQ